MLCLGAAAALCLRAQADSLSPALAPHSLPVAGQPQRGMRLLSLRSSAATPTLCTPAPDASVLSDPHASFAFVPRSGSLPDCHYFSRAVEIEYVGDDAHDPGNRFYAIRYGNGSVELFVRDPLTAGGIVEHYAPSMLSGQFSQMASGDEHLALLRTNGTVECRAVPGFDNSTGALFEARAAIVYKQIAAAAQFTCGLRANDSRVECFGRAAAGGSVSLNPSRRAYSSIAAASAGGFCGVSLEDSDLYCWTIQGASEDLPTLNATDYPAPFAKPMWAGQSTEGCVLLTTGTIACHNFNPLVVDLAQTIPLDQATIQGGFIQGAARDDYRAVSYTLEGEKAAGDYVFTPMRFIGVDAQSGNDTLCTCVRAMVPSELASFIPCRTIAGAFARLSYPNTWIQLLPGIHHASLLTVQYASVTFSSQPPSVFSAAELESVDNGSWSSRIAATAGQASVWNCTGSINCLTGQLHELTVSGLTFVGSEQHAIAHTAPVSLPFVAVAIIDCKFTCSGGMLINSDGPVVIQRSEVFAPVGSLAVEGLLHVEESALTMSDTWFHEILLPDAEFRMRTTVFIRTVNRATQISIRNCTWEGIEVGTTTDIDTVYIGGIALQMITGATTMELTDSAFRRLSTHCPYCNGGAVSITVPCGSATDPETAASITFANSTFVDIHNPRPGYEGSAFVSDGAGIWIGAQENPEDGLETVTVAVSLTLADLQFQRVVAHGRGAALFLGILHALQVDRIDVRDCVAENGGAMVLLHTPIIGFRFAQQVFAVNDLVCNNNSAESLGGQC